MTVLLICHISPYSYEEVARRCYSSTVTLKQCVIRCLRRISGLRSCNQITPVRPPRMKSYEISSLIHKQLWPIISKLAAICLTSTYVASVRRTVLHSLKSFCPKQVNGPPRARIVLSLVGPKNCPRIIRTKKARAPHLKHDKQDAHHPCTTRTTLQALKRWNNAV